jgi:hypothetical protein
MSLSIPARAQHNEQEAPPFFFLKRRLSPVTPQPILRPLATLHEAGGPPAAGKAKSKKNTDRSRVCANGHAIFFFFPSPIDAPASHVNEHGGRHEHSLLSSSLFFFG